MDRASARNRAISIVQRAQLVQLVLVDGWTAGQAAAAFGIDGRLVAAWVAAYRRDGMASLHLNPGEGFAGAIRSWLRRPFAAMRRRFTGAWSRFAGGRVAAPSPLRRSRDDRRSGA